MTTQLTFFFIATYMALYSTLVDAVTCGPGSYKKGTSCLKCPPGTYQPYDQNMSKCLSCPVNTFTASSGVVDRTLCQSCPINSFAKPGSSKCTKCPGSKVRLSPTSTKCSLCSSIQCKPCPKNFVRCGDQCKPQPNCPSGFIPPPKDSSYFPDSVCISPVTGCPKGLKLLRWIRRPLCVNSKGDVVCPGDHVFDGVDRCLSCSSGMRVVYSKQAGRYQCSVCDGRSVSRGGVSKLCSTCPGNKYKSLDGSKCQTFEEFKSSLSVLVMWNCVSQWPRPFFSMLLFDRRFFITHAFFFFFNCSGFIKACVHLSTSWTHFSWFFVQFWTPFPLIIISGAIMYQIPNRSLSL